MRQKRYNPISTTGYYFSETLNLAPGENMDIHLLTKKQAQEILKSEIVNNIELNDLKMIRQIAEAPEITVPFPLRSGQILVSEAVGDEMNLVWVDYDYLPKKSQAFPVPKLSEKLFTKYANCKYVERQGDGYSYAEIVKTESDSLFYIATPDLMEATLTIVFEGAPLIIAGNTTDSLENRLDYTTGGYLEIKTNQLITNVNKEYNNVLYDFSINPGDYLYITGTEYGYTVQNQQGQSFTTPNGIDYLLIGSTSGQSIKILDCGLPVNLNEQPPL